MAIDRDLQREILIRLSEKYPDRLDLQQWAREVPTLRANLYYLYEHGLMEGSESREMSGSRFINGQITAKGIDFLEGDGGLTAILGVVTVRLHDETIRDLIAARIQESDLPAEEKTGLLHQLKELRGESIKHLTMKLLDAGLENAPKAIPLIQKALESLMT